MCQFSSSRQLALACGTSKLAPESGWNDSSDLVVVAQTYVEDPREMLKAARGGKLSKVEDLLDQAHDPNAAAALRNGNALSFCLCLYLSPVSSSNVYWEVDVNSELPQLQHFCRGLLAPLGRGDTEFRLVRSCVPGPRAGCALLARSWS